MSRLIRLTIVVTGFALQTFLSVSQTSIKEYSALSGVGEWRDHLPYSHTIKVTESTSKIYCATNLNLFSYDRFDNSVERFSKVTGLSDVEISSIKYSLENELLLVAYKNANIDLIKNRTIYNISDIKNKQIIGSKTVNDILFIENLAYLSCSFGIVVLDITKIEIKDTYYIGDGGASVNVYELIVDDNYLYAATEEGIYRAEKDNPNLINYIYWERMEGFVDYDQKFTSLASFNSKIFANLSNDSNVEDIVYIYDGVSWLVFHSKANTNYSIVNSNDNLIIVGEDEITVYNTAEVEVLNVTSFDFGPMGARDAIYSDDDYLWIADTYYGLVRYSNLSQESIHPNGPISEDVIAMSVVESNLNVAGGGLDPVWNNIFRSGEIYSYFDGKWESTINYDIRDVVNVLVDPTNTDRTYVASWGYGLLEYVDGTLINQYDITNSSQHTLQSIIPGDNYIRIKGLALDDQHNLWMTNSGVDNPISVKKADNSWTSLPYGDIISAPIVGEIIITQDNYKWVTLPLGNGLLVFDENSTIDNLDDDLVKKISILDVNGNLITNDIYSIAEDLNGNIWLGTDMGVVAYYAPENVFSEEPFYAQRVTIPDEEGEIVNYLLEKEKVLVIAVDGADRKWIGTESAGVFLVSKDGTEEILAFNKDNSPLLSNLVRAITIDHNTGDVYFGTDKGIVSYKGSATKGGEDFGKVYVFPNPVREGYDGEITITGLVDGTIVKITDITGNLVYETRGLGGQAFWNGTTLRGRKVHTGVYLVFCSNEDGSKTFVTKLLFIR